VYHVELRQFPNATRAFNLSRAELSARILKPWVDGVSVQWGERSWNPEKARLVVYEGRELEPAEIGLGRGWANATRTGTEVTEQLLQETRQPPALEQFKVEVLERCAAGSLPLGELMALAGRRHPQARASERLALAEDATWQLLHEDRVALARGADRLAAADWSAALLAWESWAETGLTLERRT
jgi:hypothetical protein